MNREERSECDGGTDEVWQGIGLAIVLSMGLYGIAYIWWIL